MTQHGAGGAVPPDDGAAFAQLFQGCEREVARLCRRILGDETAAEDAAGELFLRARRGFSSYDPARPFRPWLLRIASNVCIDELRRRGREERLFDARDLEPGDLSDGGPSPLGRVSLLEDRQRVVRALDALPLKYRLPLVLRFFNELDYDAIAQTLAVTRNQVGTLLFRAKRRLRDELTKDSEDAK